MNKYDINYYQCSTCDFIQTEEPYWLNEAYEEAISPLDVGYVTRNIVYAEQVSKIISFFNTKSQYIDYGGGYGIFVRLMRDRGYDFYRQDSYCVNLFAVNFDISDAKSKKFELLTAFEVFEHLVNPLEEIEKMLKISESILFSTLLQPSTKFKQPDDWWYFLPYSGQHVSLFTKKSLNFLSKKYNLNLYSNGKDFHLLTTKKFLINPIKIIYYFYKARDKMFGLNFLNKKSLVQKDFEMINKLKK